MTARISTLLPQEIRLEVLQTAILCEADPAERWEELSLVCKDWYKDLHDKQFMCELLLHNVRIPEKVVRSITIEPRTRTALSFAWTNLVELRLSQIAPSTNLLVKFARWFFLRQVEEDIPQLEKISFFQTWFDSLPQGTHQLIQSLDFTNLCANTRLYLPLLRCLPNLVTLSLNERFVSSIHSLSDTQFRSFFRYVPRLCTLSVEQCDSLTNRAFTNLQNLAPNLTAFELKQCKKVDRIFKELIPFASQLQKLVLEDLSLKDPLELDKFLRAAINMHTLSLPKECQIDSDALGRFVSQNPQMISLSIPGQRRLRNWLLYAIAEHCPKLVTLNVSGCTQFLTSGVLTVVQNCRKISVLALRELPTIGHDALMNIKNIGRPITFIDIRGCEITHMSIRALKKALPHAQILYNKMHALQFQIHAQIIY